MTRATETGSSGRSGERIHLPFVIGAFAVALLGGFSLAVALPISALLRGVNVSWVEHAQVHGHLQAVGFAGLFIMGVGYRIVPRFTGHPLAYPRLVTPSLYLLASGLLARFVGQPVADHEPFGALMAASGWLELAGAGCFALVVLATASEASRRAEPTALLFSAGATWFLVSSALNAAWLTELWRNDGTLLAGDRDGAVLLALIAGVHLSFVFGVALRTFPVFFAAARPGPGPQRAAILVSQGGLALAGLAGVIDVAVGPRPRMMEAVGLALLGVGVVWLTTFTGWWRRPLRLRPGSQPMALTLQFAMLWAAAAGALLVGSSARAMLEGEAVGFGTIDAFRHLVGVGVVTTAIVGMAQLILPEYAGERLRHAPGAWRGTGLAIALAVATVFRASARLLADELPQHVDYWLMAIAGTIAFAVVAILAYTFWRAVRGYGDIIQLAEARIRGGTT